jgi:hypothetical protein
MKQILKWISAPLFSIFLLGAVSGEADAVVLNYSPSCAVNDRVPIQIGDEHTWLELSTGGPIDSLATVRVGNRGFFNVQQGQSSCLIDLTNNELRQLHLDGEYYCYGARTNGSGLATVELELHTGPVPNAPGPCHSRLM